MNLLILFGQTATGKTAKALELVDQYNGEIVNFDSRQIYKKLDIVTGKDLKENSKFKLQIQIQNKTVGYYEVASCKLQATRLWLYDIIDPKDTFSSAEYVAYAENVIQDIVSRGKTPILVGGTGYYLRHLLFGTPEIDIKEDWNLRKVLEGKTVKELQAILKEKNPHMVGQLNNSDRNNPRRLIRRIEIATSGRTLPSLSQRETLSARLGNCGCQSDLMITYLPFFHSSTAIAREKITLRVEERIKRGAIDEVAHLLKKKYSKTDPGLNAIGYEQIIAYLNNEMSLDEAKKQWITKEMQYAKRQKTYFKKYFFNPK